jgi:hypothetical protein
MYKYDIQNMYDGSEYFNFASIFRKVHDFNIIFQNLSWLN